MVRIVTVHEIDMQCRAASVDESPEEFLNQLCVKTSRAFTSKVNMIDKKRSVLKVNHHGGQGLVHRHQPPAIAFYSLSIP